MKYRIMFWHGCTVALEKKVANAGCINEDGNWVYHGSLDTFARDYKDKFVYFHDETTPTIGVTTKNSFGAH